MLFLLLSKVQGFREENWELYGLVEMNWEIHFKEKLGVSFEYDPVPVYCSGPQPTDQSKGCYVMRKANMQERYTRGQECKGQMGGTHEPCKNQTDSTPEQGELWKG